MREALEARVAAAIDAASGGTLEPLARDALLADLARWQAERVAPYGRVVAKHAARGDDPRDWPALPTEVFRHVRVAGHPASADVRVFRTSGTTSGRRGEHAFSDLALYDRAAEAAARLTLFADGPMRLVILAPHPDEAPDSSLSYMLGRFEAWFGRTTDWVFPIDARLEAALDAAADEPVALLGTSFAFVHAEERLTRRFTLAPGSRVMQTGGFKGRSREVGPAELRQAIAARYGVPEASVVAEYGMTELSSQLYERLGATTPGRLWVPPWVRARVVDPERLAEVPEGVQGILRIDDVANLDSVCAIQTSDLAVRRGASIELIGRAPGAVPRGCSLAVEEALS